MAVQGVILSVPLNITFNQGSGNELTIGGWAGGKPYGLRMWCDANTPTLTDVAADLDKIIVYDV